MSHDILDPLCFSDSGMPSTPPMFLYVFRVYRKCVLGWDTKFRIHPKMYRTVPLGI
jgi:hypothetical protein